MGADNFLRAKVVEYISRNMYQVENQLVNQVIRCGDNQLVKQLFRMGRPQEYRAGTTEENEVLVTYRACVAHVRGGGVDSWAG